MTLLNIKNLEVKYGIIPALKHISLSVKKEEIVCLIGANGAGKSTLLKTIMGQQPIVSGEICYHDRLLVSSRSMLRTDQITASGISMVPEGKGIFTDMTVKENLEIGAYRERRLDQIKKKIDQSYERFPLLKNRRDQKAGSLSGGEQQMLAIARGLMMDPELLLLDEPSLGLAPLVIRDIFALIEQINRTQKTTILLVEQNASQALSVSHRAYVLENGKIVLADQADKIRHDPRVKAAYLGT